SGTVTTLAVVHLGLPRYQLDRVDGIHLSRDTIVATSALLRRLSCQARAAHPCIGVQRADLVIAGCAIVETVLTLWPLPRLRVGDRGLRQGMLTRMIEQDLAGAAVPCAASQGAVSLAGLCRAQSEALAGGSAGSG